MLKIAFVGFRHGHVMGLWNQANSHPDIRVVAACEEDQATRDQLASAGKVKITHDSYANMLADVDCDVIATGDYFAKRGQIAITALRAGKHVIADKPLCTSLAELDQIEQLAQSKSRSIGCLLDLRDHGIYRAMRTAIRAGVIGEVHTVNFTAQHPLLWGKRAAWYFEPNKHGGTINDIAIHAIDLIPWLTGRQITEVTAARAWNARTPQVPHFQDAGQLMLKLDNAGGVLGDVSYLTPDALAYAAPQYWRVTCHGEGGVIEGSYNAKSVQLASKADASPRELPIEPERPGGVVEDFLAELAGRSAEGMLTTRNVLSASRKTLVAQACADQNRFAARI